MVGHVRLFKTLDQLLDLPHLNILLRLVRLWSTHVGGIRVLESCLIVRL